MSREDFSEVPPGAWERSPTAGAVARKNGLSQSERTFQTIRIGIHSSPPPYLKEIKLFARQSGDARPSPERADGLCFETSEPEVSQL